MTAENESVGIEQEGSASDKGRIFIIDDNPYSAEMLEELLLRNGYEVFRALNGAKALETVPQAEPDLILIEVRLPDTNGFALGRLLKTHEALRDIPLVFMSALDDVDNKVKGFQHGDDHISKPIEPREALARIERQVTVSRVRQALRESEAKFRSVTESAIDAIISADHTGRIMSWNSAATEILGFTAEEVVGHPLEIIIPERFHEPHRRGMKRVTEGGESRVIGKTVELFARTKSGVEVPIELSLSTWTVRDERYYTGIIRDISERKLAEDQLKSYAEELARQHEELKLAQAQLIEAEKQAMLGRLVAGILHEVNTPLGALRSATDTIRRILQNVRDFVTERGGDLDEAARKLLHSLDLSDDLSNVISDGTRRIGAVVDGLGHFVSAHGAERRTQDLREGLESVLTVLHLQFEDRIRIVTSFPEEAVPVRCDPARLNHAFLNLLQNAVEAIEDQGEIHVGLEAGKSRARVTIGDTGRGMTPEQTAHAFDFDFSKKSGRVRLRLGLATSRRTVEELGGTLSLESASGKGTLVRVELPLDPT